MAGLGSHWSAEQCSAADFSGQPKSKDGQARSKQVKAGQSKVYASFSTQSPVAESFTTASLLKRRLIRFGSPILVETARWVVSEIPRRPIVMRANASQPEPKRSSPGAPVSAPALRDSALDCGGKWNATPLSHNPGHSLLAVMRANPSQHGRKRIFDPVLPIPRHPPFSILPARLRSPRFPQNPHISANMRTHPHTSAHIRTILHHSAHFSICILHPASRIGRPYQYMDPTLRNQLTTDY